MKYTLIGYVPTAVILKESTHDGRSWVRYPGDDLSDTFWVGTHQLYDTVEECVKDNRQTILDGIKQFNYEIKQKEMRVDAMRKLILDT